MLGLLYAAEAYHSRGAIRYVVGGMHLKDENVKAKLTLLDRWCTMLENWGDSMKVYKEATAETAKVEETLIQMSKYMWRTWKALPEISSEMDIELTVSISIFEMVNIKLIVLHKTVFISSSLENEQTTKKY